MAKAPTGFVVPTGIIKEVSAELKNSAVPKVRSEFGSNIEEKLV
jgi:hypothetical protein